MIDGIPSRVPQSPDKRAVPRAEPVRRQPELQRQPVPVEPSPPVLQKASPAPKRSKKPIWASIIVVIALVLGLAGWYFWNQMNGATATVDSDKYQAVSMSDGQIYFGKLSFVDKEYAKLTDAYYLQAEVGEVAGAEEAEVAQQANGNVRLIKLSNKIYGPEDGIIISKSHIISYENLSPGGQVADWLEENSSAN